MEKNIIIACLIFQAIMFIFGKTVLIYGTLKDKKNGYSKESLQFSGHAISALAELGASVIIVCTLFFGY